MKDSPKEFPQKPKSLAAKVETPSPSVSKIKSPRSKNRNTTPKGCLNSSQVSNQSSETRSSQESCQSRSKTSHKSPDKIEHGSSPKKEIRSPRKAKDAAIAAMFSTSKSIMSPLVSVARIEEVHAAGSSPAVGATGRTNKSGGTNLHDNNVHHKHVANSRVTRSNDKAVVSPDDKLHVKMMDSETSMETEVILQVNKGKEMGKNAKLVQSEVNQNSSCSVNKSPVVVLSSPSGRNSRNMKQLAVIPPSSKHVGQRDIGDRWTVGSPMSCKLSSPCGNYLTCSPTVALKRLKHIELFRELTQKDDKKDSANSDRSNSTSPVVTSKQKAGKRPKSPCKVHQDEINASPVQRQPRCAKINSPCVKRKLEEYSSSERNMKKQKKTTSETSFKKPFDIQNNTSAGTSVTTSPGVVCSRKLKKPQGIGSPSYDNTYFKKTQNSTSSLIAEWGLLPKSTRIQQKMLEESERESSEVGMGSTGYSPYNRTFPIASPLPSPNQAKTPPIGKRLDSLTRKSPSVAGSRKQVSSYIQMKSMLQVS